KPVLFLVPAVVQRQASSPEYRAATRARPVANPQRFNAGHRARAARPMTIIGAPESFAGNKATLDSPAEMAGDGSQSVYKGHASGGLRVPSCVELLSFRPLSFRPHCGAQNGVTASFGGDC